MAEDQPLHHIVSLSSDKEGDSPQQVEYVIRGLQEDEIPEWAAFCASVFGYKPNPPPASYFERHFWNDPQHDASLVRVAFCEGKMVASVRVFIRTIDFGGEPISAGGIGEVCTDAQHRRRGLSKLLLNNAIQLMQPPYRNIQISMLHAAPQFFPVYESVGYVGTTTSWSVATLESASLTNAAEAILSGNPNLVVEPAVFPDDTPKLSQIHKAYSEQQLAGCIVRSEKYWNEYLKVELGDSLFVLRKGEDVMAWMSLRSRSGRFQVQEFGFNEEAEEIHVAQVLAPLLDTALAKLLEPEKKVSGDQLQLVLPAFILEQTSWDNDDLSFLDLDNATTEIDQGWMYRIFDDGYLISDLEGYHEPMPHLIWPSDSF